MLTVSAALYPFAPHFLDRGGLRYHYVDEGEGEPIVFVHGNPTWSFFFRDLLRDLRADYRVVAPDHMGCGRSDRPDDARYSYRLSSRVTDLAALIDHVAPGRKVTLVVHDWGGMIGLAWATQNPERLARLVVLNTAAFGMPPGKRLPWQIALIRNTLLGPILVRGFNAFVQGLVRYCSHRPLSPAVKAGYLAPYRSWKDRLAVLRFIQDIPLSPRDPSFALVRATAEGLTRLNGVPTLICWGERDFVFDLDFLAGWQDRMPHAEVHRFADAGHLVLDDAGDRIVPLVRDFLRRHPPHEGSPASS